MKVVQGGRGFLLGEHDQAEIRPERPECFANVDDRFGAKVQIQKGKVAVLLVRTDNGFAFAFYDMCRISCLLQSIEQNLAKIRICSDQKQIF